MLDNPPRAKLNADLSLPGRLAGEVGSLEEAVQFAFISPGERDQHVPGDP